MRHKRGPRGHQDKSLHPGDLKMKNRIILLAFLSGTLALPGVAQQSNSNTTDNGASAQGPLEPLPSTTPKDFWDGDDPNFGNLIMHPFATKKYVQRKVNPIKDRINELDELTSENGRMIKDVDARAQQGLQMASEKSSVADQHASDAANKAQLAQTTATQASARVSNAEQMVGSLDQYKGSAETEIRFHPGQSALSKNAKDALDQMAEALKDQKSYIIEVRGFSPGRGQAAISSSRKMADSVVRYLVTAHQVPVYRIYVMSMGNAAVASDGTAPKRVSSGRVEVSVLKNDLMNTAQR
jgi:outer membrane protein OmpA-like peptidoglycan-associated protein